MTREEWAVDVLLREGFDVDIGECKIRYPSRLSISAKAQEAVDYLTIECEHNVIPSGDDL